MAPKKRFRERKLERPSRKEKKLKIEPELKKVLSLIGRSWWTWIESKGS